MPCRIAPHPPIQILLLSLPRMSKPSPPPILFPISLMTPLFKKEKCLLVLSFVCSYLCFVCSFLCFVWFAYGHRDVVTKHLLYFIFCVVYLAYL